MLAMALYVQRHNGTPHLRNLLRHEEAATAGRDGESQSVRLISALRRCITRAGTRCYGSERAGWGRRRC